MELLEFAQYLAIGLAIGMLANAAYMLVHVLRISFWPIRDEDVEQLPELPGDEAAAIGEIESLGFVRLTQWRIESGPHQFLIVLFRHPEVPSFATVSLQAGGWTAYPVTFTTFLSGDRTLSTVNRTKWISPHNPEGVLLEDAYAASLAAHWEFHQARLAGQDTILPRDDEAARDLRGAYARHFSWMCEQGHYVEKGGRWHLRLRPALSAVREWTRSGRKLMSRYESVVTREPHQTRFYARCYETQELIRESMPQRPNVRASLLVLSLLVSLVAARTIGSWGEAVALVGILLFHESGHAFAMWAFGYRDLSMFFVPFLGAFVSGTATGLAAWKQAVVLLAGPVPGIVLGLVLLSLFGTNEELRVVGLMAIVINLFNLLPLAPLDGGRLVELALFSRWPRLRVAFAALGALAIGALSLAFDSDIGVLFALLLAFSLRTQWRVAQLHAAWRDGASRTEQAENLFAMAHRKFPPQAFVKQYAMLQAVFTHRSVAIPGIGESVFIVCALAGVWGGSLRAAVEVFPSRAQWYDDRTEAQVAFDAEYMDDDWVFEDSDEAEAAHFTNLRSRAEALPPDDPRRVDLRLDEIVAGPDENRVEALAVLLREGRGGNISELADIERKFLDALVEGSDELPPADRAARLEDAIRRSEEIRPGGFGATMRTRLRLVEAIDQSGRTGEAEARLVELTRSDPAQCMSSETLLAHRGRAWFLMSKGRAAEAIESLREVGCIRNGEPSYCSPALEYAWALLQTGRADEAVDEMSRAAYMPGKDRSLLQRMLGSRRSKGYYLERLDMAYALHKAGRTAEAEQILDDGREWTCRQRRDEIEISLPELPWQQQRKAALREAVEHLCPTTKRKRGSSPDDASEKASES